MSRQPRLAEYAHELHRASAIAADVVGGRGGQHEIVMRPAGECRDVARAHIGPERKSRFATHLIDQPRALDRGVRSSGGASCARFFRPRETCPEISRRGSPAYFYLLVGLTPPRGLCDWIKNRWRCPSPPSRHSASAPAPRDRRFPSAGRHPPAPSGARLLPSKRARPPALVSVGWPATLRPVVAAGPVFLPPACPPALRSSRS